ncbi:MAG: response regulator [Gammaproteobacteria bacterium]|nr:response regulator [Gammaproteobacteria bacterium]MCD8543099.1 response regulator [Gammaproteobacteria bacterium]
MANILVVEDDVLVSDMLSQVLTRAQHRVKVATDGEDAVNVLQSFTPDVMVTDILMPKKSGTTLISEVKNQHPGMSIIAISGGGRADPIGYLDLSEELGAEISFAKPVDNDAILMTIDLMMAKKRKKI